MNDWNNFVNDLKKLTNGKFRSKLQGNWNSGYLAFAICLWYTTQATSQMLRRPSHFTRAHEDMSRPVLQVITDKYKDND